MCNVMTSVAATPFAIPMAEVEAQVEAQVEVEVAVAAAHAPLEDRPCVFSALVPPASALAKETPHAQQHPILANLP